MDSELVTLGCDHQRRKDDRKGNEHEPNTLNGPARPFGALQSLLNGLVEVQVVKQRLTAQMDHKGCQRQHDNGLDQEKGLSTDGEAHLGAHVRIREERQCKGSKTAEDERDLAITHDSPFLDINVVAVATVCGTIGSEHNDINSPDINVSNVAIDFVSTG